MAKATLETLAEKAEAAQAALDAAEQERVDELLGTINDNAAAVVELQNESIAAQNELQAMGYRVTNVGGGKKQAKGSGGPRQKNSQPLYVFIQNAVEANPGGMSLGEIEEAVVAAGYKTTAADLKRNIAQCISQGPAKEIVEAKTRGVYTLIK